MRVGGGQVKHPRRLRRALGAKGCTSHGGHHSPPFISILATGSSAPVVKNIAGSRAWTERHGAERRAPPLVAAVMETVPQNAALDVRVGGSRSPPLPSGAAAAHCVRPRTPRPATLAATDSARETGLPLDRVGWRVQGAAAAAARQAPFLQAAGPPACSSLRGGKDGQACGKASFAREDPAQEDEAKRCVRLGLSSNRSSSDRGRRNEAGQRGRRLHFVAGWRSLRFAVEPAAHRSSWSCPASLVPNGDESSGPLA